MATQALPDNPDFVRALVWMALQMAFEQELTAHLGAEWYKRTEIDWWLGAMFCPGVIADPCRQHGTVRAMRIRMRARWDRILSLAPWQDAE